MKILIFEDEKPAAEKLVKFLKMYDNNCEIVKIIPSVHEGLKWFENPDQNIDLIIADIQLTDGTTFDIFNQVKINQPVIFTTAYNEYAINAFKVNSIDYLLKPINFEALYQSLEKIERFRESLPSTKQRLQFEQLSQTLEQLKKNYKTRFMVKVGEHIRSFTVEKIALFYAEGRTVYLLTKDFKQYIVDYRLEDLEEMLDPAMFYRISRSFIININAIRDVVVYSNSRLLIRLEKEFEKELIVSRDRVSYFKEWFNGME